MALAQHMHFTTAFRSLGAVLGAWLESVIGAIFLLILLQFLITGRSESSDGVHPDTLLIVVAVGAVTWLYLNRQQMHQSSLYLVAVGAGWAVLTIVAGWVFQVYLEDHVVLRFFINTLLGDENLSRLKLWRLFLIAQLVAPALLGVVRDKLEYRRSLRRHRLP